MGPRFWSLSQKNFSRCSQNLKLKLCSKCGVTAPFHSHWRDASGSTIFNNQRTSHLNWCPGTGKNVHWKRFIVVEGLSAGSGSGRAPARNEMGGLGWTRRILVNYGELLWIMVRKFSALQAEHLEDTLWSRPALHTLVLRLSELTSYDSFNMFQSWLTWRAWRFERFCVEQL